MTETLPPKRSGPPDCAQTPGVDCRDAMTQLWDYLDQELTEERMQALHQHLESCSGCLPHHDFAKAFLDALAATRSVPETGCPQSVRGKVLDRLRGEGYCGKC